MEKEIIYASIFSAVIPILAGITVIKKNTLIIYWVILVLCMASFASDVLSLLYFIVLNGATYWIINIYQISEIILIGYFFYLYLNTKRVVLITTLVIFLYFLYQILILDFHSFYGTTLSVRAVINILFCLLVFYQFYKSEEEVFIDQSPIFWINIGMLTYFSGGLFSFLLSADILQIEAGFNWQFHNIANILKNILFAIGLWKVRVAT